MYILLLLTCMCSCKHAVESGNSTHGSITQSPEINKKPPSTFQDSLKIEGVAVVFYQPDSLQLENIKKVTSPSIFDGSMHEYYYQVRNAHLVLKKDWPKVKVIDAKNVRYLQFIKTNKTTLTKDLNDFGDAYGMFLFDGLQDPSPVDMTNLEEALLYFSRS